MYPISNALKNAFINGEYQELQFIAESSSPIWSYSSATFPKISMTDIQSQSFMIDRSCWAHGYLDFGSCVASECSFTLYNPYVSSLGTRKFDVSNTNNYKIEKSFFSVKVVIPSLNETPNEVFLGTFFVNEVEYKTDTIDVKALDVLSAFDKIYHSTDYLYSDANHKWAWRIYGDAVGQQCVSLGANNVAIHGASVDLNMFIDYVNSNDFYNEFGYHGQSGDYVFTWNGYNWKLDYHNVSLRDFGIYTDGTVISGNYSGETITISCDTNYYIRYPSGDDIKQYLGMELMTDSDITGWESHGFNNNNVRTLRDIIGMSMYYTQSNMMCYPRLEGNTYVNRLELRKYPRMVFSSDDLRNYWNYLYRRYVAETTYTSAMKCTFIWMDKEHSPTGIGSWMIPYPNGINYGINYHLEYGHVYEMSLDPSRPGTTAGRDDSEYTYIRELYDLEKISSSDRMQGATINCLGYRPNQIWYTKSSPDVCAIATDYKPEPKTLKYSNNSFLDEVIKWLASTSTEQAQTKITNWIKGSFSSGLAGFTYYPFTCETITPKPWIEPMDMLEYEDIDGKVYVTIVSHTIYRLNSPMTIEAEGSLTTNYSEILNV